SANSLFLFSFPTRRSSDLCGFFFTMLAGTFSSVLMGLQRYDLTSRVSVATNAGLNLAVVALLWAGWGLKGAVIASAAAADAITRSEEHTSELQSRENLVCR